jgi:predicted porin
MKRNLIALAVAAALIAPIAANAAPKVYGKLNLSAESYKKHVDNVAADEEYTRLQSNASRFGAKGEDELTADLSAVYQIEWEVAAEGDDIGGITATVDVNGDGKIDSNDKQPLIAVKSDKLDLTQRNRYVGIKSQQFGTVKLGKYDTYTKLAQGEIDLFNDYLGDMKYIIAGENRVNNVIGYESPKFLGGVTVNVMAQTQDVVNAPKNGQSASVVYSNEDLGMYYALAIDNNINGVTALAGTRQSDTIRLVGSYKITDLTLNTIYETSEQSNPAVGANKNKEVDWQLGAAYKVADETLKLQFGEAKADNEKFATQKHTLFSIGADHNFTSKTKAFVWYTELKEDKLAVNSNTKITAFAAGVEHKF